MITNALGLVADSLSPFFDPSLFSLSKLYSSRFTTASWISLSYLVICIVTIGEWLISYLRDKSLNWYIRIAYVFVSVAISFFIWKFSMEFVLLVGVFLSLIVDALAGFFIAQEIREHPRIAFIVLAMSGIAFYVSLNLEIFDLSTLDSVLVLIKVAIIAFVVSSIWDQMKGFRFVQKNVNDFSFIVFFIAIILSLVIRIDGIGTNIGSLFFINIFRYSLTYIQPFIYVGSLLFGLFYWVNNTKWFPIRNWDGIIAMLTLGIVFLLAGTVCYVEIESLSSVDIRKDFPVIFNPEYNAEKGSPGQFTGRILGADLVAHNRIPGINACIDTGLEYIPLELDNLDELLGKQAVLNVRFTGEARNFDIVSLEIE